MNQTVIEKLKTFFASYTSITFKKGSLLINPHDQISSIYFLEKGIVRMYSISESGIDTTLHLFKPNSFFPIMMAFSDQINEYYFEALEEVDVKKAPKKQVVAFITTNQDILLDLTTRFSYALLGFIKRIEQLSSQNAYDRILSLLLYLAKQFGRNQGNEVVIQRKFSHQDLANWTGLTRETVSRQIEILTKQNMLYTKDHFIVLSDKKKLETNLKTH